MPAERQRIAIAGGQTARPRRNLVGRERGREGRSGSRSPLLTVGTTQPGPITSTVPSRSMMPATTASAGCLR